MFSFEKPSTKRMARDWSIEHNLRTVPVCFCPNVSFDKFAQEPLSFPTQLLFIMDYERKDDINILLIHKFGNQSKEKNQATCLELVGSVTSALGHFAGIYDRFLLKPELLLAYYIQVMSFLIDDNRLGKLVRATIYFVFTYFSDGIKSLTKYYGGRLSKLSAFDDDGMALPCLKSGRSGATPLEGGSAERGGDCACPPICQRYEILLLRLGLCITDEIDIVEDLFKWCEWQQLRVECCKMNRNYVPNTTKLKVVLERPFERIPVFNYIYDFFNIIPNQDSDKELHFLFLSQALDVNDFRRMQIVVRLMHHNYQQLLVYYKNQNVTSQMQAFQVHLNRPDLRRALVELIQSTDDSLPVQPDLGYLFELSAAIYTCAVFSTQFNSFKSGLRELIELVLPILPDQFILPGAVSVARDLACVDSERKIQILEHYSQTLQSSGSPAFASKCLQAMAFWANVRGDYFIRFTPEGLQLIERNDVTFTMGAIKEPDNGFTFDNVLQQCYQMNDILQLPLPKEVCIDSLAERVVRTPGLSIVVRYNGTLPMSEKRFCNVIFESDNIIKPRAFKFTKQQQKSDKSLPFKFGNGKSSLKPNNTTPIPENCNLNNDNEQPEGEINNNKEEDKLKEDDELKEKPPMCTGQVTLVATVQSV